MQLVLEWVYAGNYRIYSSLEKVRGEGERLTEKIDVGKAHSKQRAVYDMAQRRVCLQNGVAEHRKHGRGGERCWRGKRPRGRACSGVDFSALIEMTPGGTGSPAAPSSVSLRHDAQSIFLPQPSFF